jgi:hypothetical protein
MGVLAHALNTLVLKLAVGFVCMLIALLTIVVSVQPVAVVVIKVTLYLPKLLYV